jgi:hypothetical protein
MVVTVHAGVTCRELASATSSLALDGVPWPLPATFKDSRVLGSAQVIPEVT